MIFRLNLKFIKYRLVLFIGAFITLLLGTFLVGNTALAMASAITAPAQIDGVSVDMGGIITILAFSAVVSGFITISVVSGTFSFSVALRRRELALLRLVGGSGGQVRRMIMGEALVISVVAGVIGCILALNTLPMVLGALNNTGLSPVSLSPAPPYIPLVIAFAASLIMANVGAFSSSSRASRAQPVEALRDSHLDTEVMNKGRIFSGCLTLLIGSAMLIIAALNEMEAATPLTIFGSIALAISATMLAPVYLPALGYGIAKLLSAFSGTAGRLAAYGIKTSKRRTSSLAAPAITSLAIIATIVTVLAAAGAVGRGGEAADETNRLNQVVLLVLAGPALLYAVIAIANTQVMAYSVRKSDVSVMRLLGISQFQIKTIAFVESVVVIGIGAFVGIAISLLGALVYRLALMNTFMDVPVNIPWSTLLILAVAYVLCAAISSVLAVHKIAKLGR